MCSWKRRVYSRLVTAETEVIGSALSVDEKVLYIAYGVTGLGIITLEKAKYWMQKLKCPGALLIHLFLKDFPL